MDSQGSDKTLQKLLDNNLITDTKAHKNENINEMPGNIRSSIMRYIAKVTLYFIKNIKGLHPKAGH